MGIDEPRPATGAALFEPSQPTHRDLRFIHHRAFSYTLSTLPQVMWEGKNMIEIIFTKLAARELIAPYILRRMLLVIWN